MPVLNYSKFIVSIQGSGGWQPLTFPHVILLKIPMCSHPSLCHPKVSYLFQWLASRNTCISKWEEGNETAPVDADETKAYPGKQEFPCTHSAASSKGRPWRSQARSRLEAFSMLAGLQTLMLHYWAGCTQKYSTAKSQGTTNASCWNWILLAGRHWQLVLWTWLKACGRGGQRHCWATADVHS